MKLSILIVSYNSAGLLDALIPRLHEELDALDNEIVVVDNASPDGSAERLAAWEHLIHLVASPVNLGFAAGVNLAASRARGDMLLLLNPDAVPLPGSIREGLALMDAHPAVGMGGGVLMSPDGQLQPSARMFPTLLDELFTLSGLAARHPTHRLFGRLDRRWADPMQAAQVDWIPGAFVFIPRVVFLGLGGFDERFFMYYEEVDFCRRLRDMGLHVQYWPCLKATHIGGVSARSAAKGRVSRAGSQLERWRMRSALLYYRKQHGWWAAAGWCLLETSWHRLRQLRAWMRGQQERRREWAQHCEEVWQAWTETGGGQRSPARPW